MNQEKISNVAYFWIIYEVLEDIQILALWCKT